MALSLYIPQWDHSGVEEDDETTPTPTTPLPLPYFWTLNPDAGSSPGLAPRWLTIVRKFQRTILAINYLHQQYSKRIHQQWLDSDEKVREDKGGELAPARVRHGIVLAHIAAKRTDDPKVGVGAVIMEGDRYVSVGWNGYPKKSQVS